MSRQKLVGVIGGILVLSTAAAICWVLIAMLTRIFVDANPSVQAAIVAAFVAIISLTVTVVRERARGMREAHREKKIEIYSEYYDLVFEMLADSKNGDLKEIDEESPVVQRLLKISKGALFYGSPKVIKALVDLKSIKSDPKDKLAPFRPTGRILLGMREDIGLSNRGLDEISIHQIYVTDDLRSLGAK